MVYLKRSEGDLVSDESTLRQLMPYFMPRRSDAVVYFEQTIEVTSILDYLESFKNNRKDEHNLSFFHLFLAGIVRTVYHWPKMNRFISGKKIYQRHKVLISFIVKKKMHEDAKMTAVKMEFERGDTVFDVARKVNEKIKEGRDEKLTVSEKEMSVVSFLPGFVIRFLFWLQRILDGLNCLPNFMIKNDPLYTGIFIANLGSLKLDAPFHHLFEHGTAPLFGAIGRIHKAPIVNAAGEVVARDVVLIRWSFDERIVDGFYAAKALGEFERYMQNPINLEVSERPPV